MSSLTKKYKIDGYEGGLKISPSYLQGYKYNCDNGVMFIERNNTYSEDQITLAINEAKELIGVLQEIIETVENEPVVGDSVTILEGQFAGMTGRIVDIDNVAKERELAVKMDKTKYNESFYAYIDMDNVE